MQFTMWRALRVFKHYSTPQQLRLFSTTSYKRDCEDNESDSFGTLDLTGVRKLETVVQTAISKYPPEKRFNEFIQISKSDKEAVQYSSTLSQLQNLYAFEENKVNDENSSLSDIVNHSNTKYLHAKVKKEKNRKGNNETISSDSFHAYDPDGTKVEISNDKGFRSETLQQFTPYVFHRKMERLLKEHKFHDAIAVFEKEMPERNVHPDVQVYGLSIGIYAKWGYSKKAFDTYDKMKKEGIFVSKRSITSLFNACALSPWPKEDGLPRAIQLRSQLHNSGYVLNNSQYCAMMKAFGRAGEIETVFGILDEMVFQGYNIITDNINFLLQACITDKEAGFRHALMVWKKMRALRVQPDIYSYNLFLRCIRDCKAGTGDLFKDLTDTSDDSGEINQKGKSHSRKHAPAKIILTVASDAKSSSNTELVPQTAYVPSHVRQDVLKHGSLGNNTEIVGITDLKNCQQRFALIGGLQLLLKNMKFDKISPIVHTFGILTKLIPSTLEDEERLIECMKKFDITPEITIINQLITKRCKRGQLELAKETVEYISKYHMTPNIFTFAALASTCTSYDSVKSFLEDMDSANIKINQPILHILLNKSIKHSRFLCTLYILSVAEKRNILPDMQTIEVLEKARTFIRNEMLLAEKNNTGVTIRDDKRKFLLEYKQWLKRTKMDQPQHPWEQYGYKVEQQRQQIREASRV